MADDHHHLGELNTLRQKVGDERSSKIVEPDGSDPYKAANVAFLEPALRNIPVYYWGDIDKDGYEAFETARQSLKHLKPLAMDMDSIDRYFHLNQKRDSQAPLERDFALKEEYQRVCREGIRIEQEQLPLTDILTLV